VCESCRYFVYPLFPARCRMEIYPVEMGRADQWTGWWMWRTSLRAWWIYRLQIEFCSTFLSLSLSLSLSLCVCVCVCAASLSPALPGGVMSWLRSADMMSCWRHFSENAAQVAAAADDVIQSSITAKIDRCPQLTNNTTDNTRRLPSPSAFSSLL